MIKIQDNKFEFVRHERMGIWQLVNYSGNEEHVILPTYYVDKETEQYFSYLISKSTFLTCVGTKKVTIPSTVISLQEQCFWGSQIQEVEFLGAKPPKTPQSLESLATGNGQITLVYPYGCRNNYNLWLRYEKEPSNNIKVVESKNIDILKSSLPPLYQAGKEFDSIHLGKEVETIADTAFLGTIAGSGFSIEEGATDTRDFSISDDNQCIVNKKSNNKIIKRNSSSITEEENQSELELNYYTIGINSLCNNLDINTLTLGDGVKIIEDFAFQNCTNLTTIILPKTIEYCSPLAFVGCDSLETIKFTDGNSNPDNQTYFIDCIEDKIKDKELNYLYYKEKENIIPIWFNKTEEFDCQSIKFGQENGELNCVQISPFLFQNSKIYGDLTISNQIKKIGKNAFEGCAGIKRVFFEGDDNLTIENNAFSNCENLVGYWIQKDEKRIEFNNNETFFNIAFRGGDTDKRDVSVLVLSTKTEEKQQDDKKITINSIDAGSYKGRYFDWGYNRLIIAQDINRIENNAIQEQSIGIRNDKNKKGIIFIPNNKIDIANDGIRMESEYDILCNHEMSDDLPSIGSFDSNKIYWNISELTADEQFKGFDIFLQKKNLDVNNTLCILNRGQNKLTVNNPDDINSYIKKDSNFYFHKVKDEERIYTNDDNNNNDGDGNVLERFDSISTPVYIMNYYDLDGKDDNGYSYIIGLDWRKNIILNSNSFLNNRANFCQNVIVGPHIERLDNTCFSNRNKDVIKNIYLPDNLKLIGNETFQDCSNLEEINIPKSVERVGSYEGPFVGCNNLKNIWVSSSNQYYFNYDNDGNLYEDASLRQNQGMQGIYLCQYAPGKTETAFQVPDDVSTIASYAFKGCKNLNFVNLDNTVLTAIGENAFEDCEGLTTIIIPAQVFFIGKNAFNSEKKNDNIIIYSKRTGPGSDDLYSEQSQGLWNPQGYPIYYYSEEEPIDKEYQYWHFDENNEPISWPIPEEVWDISTDDNENEVYASIYELQDDTYKLIISGSGDMKGWTSSSHAPWYSSYNSKITSIVIKKGVTAIGQYAFHNCTSLTDIVIPDSVITIDDFAFWDCTSLASIEIPDSVTSMGYGTFYNCTSLTIYCEAQSRPSGWDSEWNYSSRPVIWGFEGAGITDDGYVWMASSGTATVLSYAGTKTELVIPSQIENRNVTTIGKKAFFNLSNVISIKIPNSVTAIGESAFSGCASLANVEIPDSVTTIDGYAFSDCISLASIEIPDSVTLLGEGAFLNCKSLVNIAISDNVATIGAYAFAGCSELTIYCEAESQPSDWDSDWNIDNCPVVWRHIHSYNSETDLCVCGVKNNYVEKWGISNTLSDNVTAYLYNDENKSGYYALAISGKGEMKNWSDNSYTPWQRSAHAQKISSIIVDGGITTIGDCAFRNCTNLTNIEIPDSVIAIGDFAFRNCTSLEGITIPNSVITIGEGAFAYCTNNLTIYCEAESQPSGWNKNWNPDNCHVEWKYNNQF